MSSTDRDKDETLPSKPLIEHIFDGSNEGAIFTVDAKELGAPGAPRQLISVLTAPSENRSENERFNDTTFRTFRLSMRFSKTGDNEAVFGGDSPESGSSYLKFDSSNAQLHTPLGVIKLHSNKAGELSLATMNVDACNRQEALHVFETSVSAFLDYASFEADVPVHSGVTRVDDTLNGVEVIRLVVPHTSRLIDPSQIKIREWMVPINALYREYKNSNSPFYKLLCAYKIMEGIFGVIRPRSRKTAKIMNIDYKLGTEVVLDHVNMPGDLRKYIGISINEFYSKVLTKEYRNAASHFLVQEHKVLHLGSAEARDKFTSMAFLAGVCARQVIQNQECCLQALDADIALANLKAGS